MNKKALWFLAAGSALAASQAHAQTTVLTFEGVSDQAPVIYFYGFGTDGAGNSGVNYGVEFQDGFAIVSSSSGGSGNFTYAPSGDTILSFVDLGGSFLNVQAGFDTGFSFYYSSTAQGVVEIYSGLYGTGNLLASLNLVATTTDPSSAVWVPFGTSFSGIATSVNFSGTGSFAVYDNVTLGAAIPGVAAGIPGAGGVPEPATWAMMIGGFGAIGAAMRVRRRKVSFAAA